MKPVLNRCLALILSLLVVLTGQGVAESRGMEQVAGQMVLCTGAGPVVVYVDADGQPTQPPHFCPEYALALLGAINGFEQPQLDAPKPDRPRPTQAVASLIALPIPSKPARAPPELA